MTLAVPTGLSVVGQVNYGLQESSPPFGTIQLPQNTLAFNLAGLSTNWNCLLLLSVGPIATSSGVDFNLYSFNDLFGNATGMRHVLGIEVVVNSIGPLYLSPAATDPLQWFFSGTTAATYYVQVNPASNNNAGFMWWDDPTGSGTAVGSTTRGLRLANPSGSVTPSATVLVLGSTS